MALQSDAADSCAIELSRCHIIQQKPAVRRPLRHLGWLIGPLLTLIGFVVSCVAWRWTVPLRAMDRTDIGCQFVSRQFFGLAGFAPLLVTWDRYYVRTLPGPMVRSSMFGALISYVTGRTATIPHMILNTVVAWGIYAFCAWWALTNDRIDAE